MTLPPRFGILQTNKGGFSSGNFRLAVLCLVPLALLVFVLPIVARDSFVRQTKDLSTVQAGQGIVTLSPGRTVRRTLAGGGQDAFQIDLRVGQFVRIVVTQQDLDVIISLIGPGGQRLRAVSGLTSIEREPALFWVAEKDGPYRLEVKPLDPKARQGNYLARITDLREAVARDSKLVAAETALDAGERSLAGGKAEGLAEAFAQFEEAALILRQAAEDWRTAYALRRQAFVLIAQGDLEKARRLDQGALQLLESQYGPDHLKVVPALWDLADVVARLNDLPQAHDLCERAIKIIRKSPGDESPAAAIAFTYLANILMSQNDSQGALDAIQQVVRIYEQRYGSESLHAADAYALEANILHRQDQVARAQKLLETALKIYEDHFGAESYETLGLLDSLVEFLASEGNAADAVAKQERFARIIEKRFGPMAIETANANESMGRLLLSLGKPIEARLAFNKALKLFAPRSDGAAHASLGIARALVAEGDYDRARGNFDKVIEIAETLYGQESQAVVDTLMAKLAAYPRYNDYEAGRQCYARALLILEKSSDEALADGLEAAGDFDINHDKTVEARIKYKQAIRVLEKARQGSLRTAPLRQRLGESLIAEGTVNEAVNTLRDVVKTYEDADGPNHPALLNPLNSLASALMFQSQFDDASEVLRRALKILAANHLGEQVIAAETLGRMAGLMETTGQFDIAKEGAQRALKIYEKRRQSCMCSLDIGIRNLLGETLLLKGDLSESRAVLERTIALSREQPGPEESGILITKVLLTYLLVSQGDTDKALTYLVEIHAGARVLSRSGEFEAVPYLNLASIIAVALGKKSEAREFTKQAAALAEQKLGPSNPLLGRILAVQAFVLLYLEDYADADAMASKADELIRRSGTEHVIRALPLIFKGETSIRKSKLSEGGAIIEEAVRIIEQQLGPKNPWTAQGFERLGWIKYMQGDTVGARSLFLKSADATNDHIQNTLPLLSLAEQQNFLELKVPEQISALLTSCRGGDVLQSAYGLMFRWKGSLVESLRRQAFIARLDRSGPQGEQIKQLINVKTELAGWYYKFSLVPSADWRKKNDELTDRKEQLERALERTLKTGDLVDPLADGFNNFQHVLRQDEVFVDLYLYDYEYKDESIEERYAGVLIGPHGNPSVIDLGPSRKIDLALNAWRQKLLDPHSNPDSEWQSLATILWKPLADGLASETRKIWLSPDGELARIPWQLLPATYAKSKAMLLTQADSPREFARIRERGPVNVVPQGREILLVGNIDFDAGLSQSERRSEGRTFGRLEGTQAEVESIRAIAQKLQTTAPFLTGSNASKTKVIEGLQHATYAHLATHGYFARAIEPLAKSGARTRWGALFGDEIPPKTRNPLVESGIALAGANAVDPSTLESDGLLSAEEIIGLDLTHCELLTLSACQTGRGEEVTGQGVMGLRSAVMAAGSRSMLMSLWKVPDDATVKFMEVFYTNLWMKKMSKAEALLSAQKTLSEGQYRHPYYWAGWVLVGDAW
jgi:CHAT domain-containing protein/TolA-binding protein